MDPTDSGMNALCAKDALTDGFGWTIQAVLASLAFACLILKRFCEPKRRRRSWLTWFYDTSKQGVGSTIIHFANIYLATLFQGDPCTWYLVSFLLDSSVGLLVIYAGIRSTLFFAEKYKLKLLFFGEYGSPPSARAWAAQTGVYMGIMITEKILITLLVQLKFWDQVRDLILLPIKDPKVATIIVLLVIPFFVNVLMFWVTDNFLMKKPSKRSKRAIKYQRVAGQPNSEPGAEDSDILLSGDEDLLDSTDEASSSVLAFKNAEDILNINRRNNSVV